MAPNEILWVEGSQRQGTNKKFDVTIRSSSKGTGRVVVVGKIPTGFEFHVSGEGTRPANTQETFDQRLLTGCLTFIDSDLKAVRVKLKTAFCEDGVNFIRAKGDIQDLQVEDAMSDGVDFDYSEVLIHSATINRTGNDCIDSSGGVYSIERAHFSNCEDKAVSVGENSRFTGTRIEIENSKSGVVSKDQSQIDIAQLRETGTGICLAAYRKKQEFGPATISVENLDHDGCHTVSAVDENSEIKIGR